MLSVLLVQNISHVQSSFRRVVFEEFLSKELLTDLVLSSQTLFVTPRQQRTLPD
jgi:hypothetical protein